METGDRVRGDEEAGSTIDTGPYVQAHADQLRQWEAIRSAPVERAFRRAPRHLFVRSYYVSGDGGYAEVPHDPDNPDPARLEQIYSGMPLVTRLENGLPTSASSESALVAAMLELLRIEEGMRVLEIGAGTGYNAALLAEIVGDQGLVTTVEYQPDVTAEAREALARAGYGGVRVLHADGFYGAPESAPHDRVIATVGCPDLSPHWMEQLDASGLILLPLRHGGANPLLLVERRGDAISGRFVGGSGFMAPRGELSSGPYYGPEVRESGLPPQELPAWEGLDNSAALRADWWESPRVGFWFYLVIRDPRATLMPWFRTFGLSDPDSGSSVRIEDDRIVLQGDRSLLDDLAALHSEWQQLGSPRIPDWTVSFVPTSDQGHGGSAARRWVVEGRYFARVFSLD